MLGKNTILKAIHNLYYKTPFIYWVWMLGKNTILKAIHNLVSFYPPASAGVNAG